MKEFYQELSRILEPHKDNLPDISDVTGVSRTTLWRWSNGTNRSYPDADKTLRVLAKISGLNKTKDLAKYYGGRVEEFIESFCPVSSEYGRNFLVTESPEAAISDFYSFVIYSICETKRGATEDELINVIGNIAVKRAGVPKADINQEVIYTYGLIAKSRIRDLIRKEVIYKSEGELFRATSNDLNFNINFALENLPLILKEFTKPEDFSKGYNAIFSYTESIPLETANKLAIKTKTFFKECYEEMERMKTKDGVPFTIINYAERLWFDPLDGIKGEVSK